MEMVLHSLIYFCQADLLNMRDFSRVTHLHAFFGDQLVTERTAWLIATSMFMRVAVLMCLRKEDLYKLGVADRPTDREGDEGVFWLPSCSMLGSGFCYHGALVLITPERQEKILAALEEVQQGNCFFFFWYLLFLLL